MVAIKKTKKQPTPGFKRNLKDISRYKTWPKMTKEWLFLAYYLITSQYKTCPGDPKRITHICVIINEHNHNQLEICNSCAERYMDIFESGKIENDVRRLKANIKLSMSSTSLDYLRDNHAISTDEYNGYQMVKGIRNDSYVLEFRSDINQKLLAITDYNNKSAFETIDQIVIWIHKNPQTDINIKTLFDTRHSLLSTNTYNFELLESIITENKIGPSNYSLIERAEAYKIFDKYLNVPNEEWSRFIKYYGKDLETNIVKEVLPKGVVRNKYGVLTCNLDLEPDTIIKKEVKEKVDKQRNIKSSEASVVKKKTVIHEENIQTIPTKKNDVPEKKVEYSILIDQDSEDDQSNESFNRHLEEQTITSKLLSPKTIQQISKLIIKYLNNVSNVSEIENIISELSSILDEKETTEIWNTYYKFNSIGNNFYELLTRLKFGIVSHILKQLLSKNVNVSEIDLSDILQISIVQELIEIFSFERMHIQCITVSKPTIQDDWMIGPRLNQKDFQPIKFIRNKKDGVEGLNIKDIISKSISFDAFYDHFYNWILYLVEMDSIKEILYYIDVESLWEIYNQDEKKDSFRNIFDLITVECFNNILTNIFRKYPYTISINIKDLNTYLDECYTIKYDQEQECTSIDKVYQNSEEVEIAGVQPTEPIEEVASSPVLEVKDFSYLLASNNNSKDKADKGSSDPEIERKWIESFNQSNEQSKQHARDLYKLEKDADILILDSITSQSLYHLESFILKYLKQLTSSDSIQMFALTFDQIEISDVYEVNPNITSLYTFMSKLSLGCIKNVLTQLLSQRLNKSKVNVSDILNNPMVAELKEILSGENLVLKYTGYTKPFQSAYWKIEPQ